MSYDKDGEVREAIVFNLPCFFVNFPLCRTEIVSLLVDRSFDLLPSVRKIVASSLHEYMKLQTKTLGPLKQVFYSLLNDTNEEIVMVLSQ